MTNIINNNHHLIPLEQFLGENLPGERNSPRGLTEDDIDSNWNEAIETFDGMSIPDKLLQGIYELVLKNFQLFRNAQLSI